MLQGLIDAAVQVLVFSVIPLIWWLITARKKESFFTWNGWKKPVFQGSPWNLLLFIIAVSVVYIALSSLVMTTLLSGMEFASTEYSGEGLARLPEIFIFSFIKTGLSEEIFFRGFLGKLFIKVFGFPVGNTIQAFLFGLLHGLPIGLASGNWLVIIIMTLLPGGIGWFTGWMNEKKSGGSIIPGYLLHALMNFSVGVVSAI